jgi:dihydrofolate reductase
MGKLVEATHVSLGGEIDALDEWAFPYLDEQHSRYATQLLNDADALLLGRLTYEGLSVAYTKMAESAPPGVPMDLMQHGLIDEFHLFLTPVAVGDGQRLFESIDTAPHLALRNLTRFDSDVIVLVYAPK